MADKENNQNTQNENDNSDKPLIGIELSKVASDPKQSTAIIVIALLAAIYVVYGMFTEDSNDKAKSEKKKVERPKNVVRPSDNSDLDSSPMVASLPEAPSLGDPSAPPPTREREKEDDSSQDEDQKDEDNKDDDQVQVQETKAPEPSEETPSAPPREEQNETRGRDISENLRRISRNDRDTEESDDLPTALPKSRSSNKNKKDKDKEQRLKSSIMLISGTPSRSVDEIEERANFKKRTDIEYLLGKGKIISAVIETAINTDFTSEVRAIISRDVYSESGGVILIPKGSRIFGEFSNSVDNVYGRITINWKRIDMPNGYTLNFDGVGVDNLGRQGSKGRLDPKLKENVGNIVMSTAVNVAFAKLVDKIVPSEREHVKGQSKEDAKNIQSAITSAFSSSEPARDKIGDMCQAARTSARDLNPEIVTKISDTCNEFTGSSTPSGTPEERAQSLFSRLISLTNDIVSTGILHNQPSKAQEASKKGVEEFSKIIGDYVEQSNTKPSVTMDQGTVVKIFVNRDYKFPRKAVSRSRTIK